MRSKITEYLKPNIIFSYLLVPAAVLTLYSGVFAFFSARLLPENVNYYFTFRLFKVLLILLAGLGLLLAVSLAWTKSAQRSLRALIRPAQPAISAADFLLLLLPLTPVAQFVIKNQDILKPLDSAMVLGFFALLAGVVIFLFPWLLRRFSSMRLLMVLGLAFVFTIISMASISQYFHWFKQGTLSKQVLFFGFVFVIASVFLLPKMKNLFFVLIALSFIVNSAMQFASSRQPVEQPVNVSASFEQSELAKKKPVTTPNIYLLVYDSYVHAETMQGYGIDNTAQENYLRDKGFVIYSQSYSMGCITLDSMSRTLNPLYSNDKTPREIASGEGSVQNILRYLGYQTMGIFPSDYMFRGVVPHYDVSFPPARTSYLNLISAIMMGEFRFDIGFDLIEHGVYVDKKRSAFQTSDNQPVFLYTHSNFPGHAQNSGQCLPDETEKWKVKLATANAEMREDVEMLAKADPQAIIIVAGDHGPHLTKNCAFTSDVYPASEITRLDIQDRYGAFVAIHWPTPDYKNYTQVKVLQDVFPAVLAYMYHDASISKEMVWPAFDGSWTISGVSVYNGIIKGGVDDGEPLFLSDN